MIARYVPPILAGGVTVPGLFIAANGLVDQPDLGLAPLIVVCWGAAAQWDLLSCARVFRGNEAEALKDTNCIDSLAAGKALSQV